MIKALVLTSPTYSDYAEKVLTDLNKHFKDFSYQYSSILNIHSGDIENQIKKYQEKFDGFIFLLHNDENKSLLYERAYTTAAALSKKHKKFIFIGISTKLRKPDLLKIPGTVYTYPYPVEDVSEIVKDLINVIEDHVTTVVNEKSSPEEIKRAQQMLTQLGYYSGNFTGEIDVFFIECLNAFKKNKNLPYLNRLDNETLKHLEHEVKGIYENNPQSDKTNKQWILKYDPARFTTQNLKEGDVKAFPYGPNYADRNGKQKLSQLSFEDTIWGYDITNACIKYRFSATQFSEDEIKLVVAEVYQKEIPLKLLKIHVNFANKLISTDSGRLFIAGDYSEIDINELVATYLNRPHKTLDNETSYSSDLNFDETPDQLDFFHDIEAFANIITLKKVEPPLAIGLFGHWGSGKSFFMEKLSERISFITTTKQDKFLKHIVQVKFNSWHYSDGNLWASLISHIFESLNNYATDKKFGLQLVDQVLSKLSLTNTQILDTQSKLDAKNTEVKHLKVSIEEIEDTIKIKREKLRSLKLKDYFAILSQDPEIKRQIGNLKTKYLKKDDIQSVDQILESYREFEGFANQLKQTWKLLRSNGPKWYKMLLYVAIFFLFIYVVNLPSVASWLGIKIRLATDYIGKIAIILMAARSELKPYYNDVRKFYNHIKRLKESTIQKERSIQMAEEETKDQLNASLRLLLYQKQALEAEKKQKASEKEALELHLKDISSGKMLSQFIAQKSVDENYAKHLGIVSWIRKDFSELSDLLEQQTKLNLSPEYQNKTEGKIQIERIVLYIDDLDRCNGETVVKMLEAIHLLLAFKLFVVVVGVDPRWLNNALDSQFGALFGQTGKAGSTKQNAVTSYDYLEKIFQIPFALKPINNDSRNKLVAFLTQDDLVETENKEKDIDQTKKKLRKLIQPDFNGNIISEHIYDENEELETVLPNKPINDFTLGKRIVLSKPEIEFMQKIAVNFNTPRTIKRFVNIYRLIKAHRSYKFIADTQKMDFVPTMLLLSVIVGCPDSAHDFLQRLRHEEYNQLLKDFIQKLKNDTITAFFERISDPEIDRLAIVELRENLDLISRFSFRTYLN